MSHYSSCFIVYIQTDHRSWQSEVQVSLAHSWKHAAECWRFSCLLGTQGSNSYSACLPGEIAAKGPCFRQSQETELTALLPKKLLLYAAQLEQAGSMWSPTQSLWAPALAAFSLPHHHTHLYPRWVFSSLSMQQHYHFTFSAYLSSDQWCPSEMETNYFIYTCREFLFSRSVYSFTSWAIRSPKARLWVFSLCLPGEHAAGSCYMWV